MTSLLIATTTFFLLHACNGSSNGPTTHKATSTPKGAASFPLTNVPKGSNVNRSNFAPKSLTSNYAPFNKNSAIHLIQVTGSDGVGGSLVRGVKLSENNRAGNFQSNVGKSLPVGSGGASNGGPTVLVEYYQDNRTGNRSRWRATSGTVIIDSYKRNSPTTEIVTFRLVGAHFTPIFNATGTFSLSLNATTSGQRNPT